MDAATLQQIQQLSVAERIQLLEEIWESIVIAPDTLGLTESQRKELDARLEAHRLNPQGSSWKDVKSRLQR